MWADVSPNSIIDVKFERKSLPPRDAHNSSFQMPVVCFTNILRAAFYSSLPKIQIQTQTESTQQLSTSLSFKKAASKMSVKLTTGEVILLNNLLR
jgi:hypothetical protein